MKKFPGNRGDYSDGIFLRDILHVSRRKMPLWLRYAACHCRFVDPYLEHNCGATVSDLDNAVKNPEDFLKTGNLGLKLLMDVVMWYGKHPAGTVLKRYARKHIWKADNKYRWRSANPRIK